MPLRHIVGILLPSAIVGLILGWRLVQARDLALPAWVDSVHHALVVRILLEQRTIPAVWAPYLPEVPFYYHFGFHLSAAAVAVVAGNDPGRAVLWAGHLWQAALAAGVYLLTIELSGKRSKALAALLLVGFVSQMPAYYISWGRYTLLAGLALAAFAMSAALADRTVVLAFLVAATAVTHYYALFLLLLFLALLVFADRKRRKAVAAGGLLGLVLVSPWLWRVLLYERRAIGVRVLTSSAGYDPTYLAYLLGPLRNAILLGLAAAGVILVLLRFRVHPRSSASHFEARTSGWLAFVLWTTALVVMLGPWHLGPFRPDHAAIVMFLPAVVLAPEALWRLRRPPLIGACLAVLVAWGIWQTRVIIRPETVLATADDVTAIAWAAAHTPPDAIFLVDADAWGSTWRGVDGGWWLEPLAGRRTIPPPVVHEWAVTSEAPDWDNYSRRIHALANLPDHLYCRELALLGAQTGAAYYYTRSERPGRCPDFREAYRGPGGIFIFANVTGPMPDTSRDPRV